MQRTSGFRRACNPIASITRLEWISMLTPLTLLASQKSEMQVLSKNFETVGTSKGLHKVCKTSNVESDWWKSGEPSTLANWGWRGGGRQLGTKRQLMKRPAGSAGGGWEGEWHLHIAIIGARCVATADTALSDHHSSPRYHSKCSPFLHTVVTTCRWTPSWICTVGAKSGASHYVSSPARHPIRIRQQPFRNTLLKNTGWTIHCFKIHFWIFTLLKNTRLKKKSNFKTFNKS